MTGGWAKGFEARARSPSRRRGPIYVMLQVGLAFLFSSFLSPVIDLFLFFLLIFILGPSQGGESFFSLSGVWVALKNILGNLVLGLFY